MRRPPGTAMIVRMNDVPLTDLPSHVEWCLIQAGVWEPAARALLGDVDITVRTAADMGCGPVGWLPLLLERWPELRLVGVDTDQRMLEEARGRLAPSGTGTVELRGEDLFSSSLPEAAFDLVHARTMLSTLGWSATQLAGYVRLTRPGGWIVVEEPDTTSFEPPPGTSAMAELLGLTREALLLAGKELDCGRHLDELFGDAGLEPQWRVAVVTLPPAHPYHLLPVILARQHADDLAAVVDAASLADLMLAARRDQQRHPEWTATVTLVQAWAVRREDQ